MRSQPVEPAMRPVVSALSSRAHIIGVKVSEMTATAPARH